MASGVPVRNGNQHAIEICRLSLLLLEQIKVFKIRHRPDEKLQLRLGAHTGMSREKAKCYRTVQEYNPLKKTQREDKLTRR